MANYFPYRTSQCERISVYIPVTHKYHELVNDLEHSILVMGRGLATQWDISDVQCYLVACYGGDMVDYQYLKRGVRSYLVRLPDRLNRLQVIEQMSLWGLRNDLVFTQWNPTDDGGQQQRGFLVKLRVEGFPTQLWDEEYIYLFLMQLGEVRDIDTECTFGRNRECIEAWIWSHDPLEIPTSGTVLFDDRWKECRITVTGWTDEGNDPPNDGRGGGYEAQGGWQRDMLQTGIPQPRDSLIARHQHRAPAANWDPYGGNSGTSGSDEAVHAWHSAPKEEVWSKACPPEPRSPLDSDKIEEQKDRSGTAGTITLRFGTNQPLTVSASMAVIGKRKGATSEYQERGMQGTQKKVRHCRIKVGSVHIIANCNLGQYVRPKMEKKQNREPACVITEPIKPGSECQNITPSQWSTKKGDGEFLLKGSINTGLQESYECYHNGHLTYQGPIKKATYKYNPVVQGGLNKNTPSKERRIAQKTLRINTSARPRMEGDMGNEADELAMLLHSLTATPAGEGSGYTLPQQGVRTRNWELAVIAKVIADRPAMTAHFSQLMFRVWGVDPGTQITMIATNTFLIDFVTKEDLEGVVKREPWAYRQDLIAMRRVRSQEEVSPNHVTHIGIWTQLHNIPLEAVSEAGIAYMVGLVGTPMSDVQQGGTNGKVYLRVRISQPINENLKDSITVTHPTLGPLTIPLVYEKVSRICFCCGGLGHEIHTCETYGKILSFASNPDYRDRPEVAILKNKKKGAWMTSAAFVPKPQIQLGQTQQHQNPINQNTSRVSNRNFTARGPDCNRQGFENRDLENLAIYDPLDPRGGRRGLRNSGEDRGENQGQTQNQCGGILGDGQAASSADDSFTLSNSAKRFRATSRSSSPQDR